MSAATLQPELAARNRRVGLMALAFACAMLGLGYASVPLYRLFCQVTGFGGTTQRASEAQAAAVPVSGATITMRFDANIERGMPWQFRPERTTPSPIISGPQTAMVVGRSGEEVCGPRLMRSGGE